MRIVYHGITILITAAIVLFMVNRNLGRVNESFLVNQCENGREAVEKNINALSAQIGVKVAAVGNAVSENRDFMMKLIVEQDVTAPEIIDFAAPYLRAMSLGILEITDAQFRILSSGHLPVSAGSVSSRVQMLADAKPVFVNDTIDGKEVIALECRTSFVFENSTFYVVGGVIIDTVVIGTLAPFSNAFVLLKNGSEVIGLDIVSTMSPLSGDHILINDKKWFAKEISFRWNGAEPKPELYVLVKDRLVINSLDLF